MRRCPKSYGTGPAVGLTARGCVCEVAFSLRHDPRPQVTFARTHELLQYHYAIEKRASRLSAAASPRRRTP